MVGGRNVPVVVHKIHCKDTVFGQIGRAFIAEEADAAQQGSGS